MSKPSSARADDLFSSDAAPAAPRSTKRSIAPRPRFGAEPPASLVDALSQTDMFPCFHDGSPHSDSAAATTFVSPSGAHLSIVPPSLAPKTDSASYLDDYVDREMSWSDDLLRREQAAWLPSDREIADIHEACLRENLSALTQDVPWIEKAHVLQWIFTVDQIDGVDVRSIPFSFHNCCLCSGIADVEEFRVMLLNVEVVRDLLVQFRFYSASDLPPRRPPAVTSTDDFGDTGRDPFERIYLDELPRLSWKLSRFFLGDVRITSEVRAFS